MGTDQGHIIEPHTSKTSKLTEGWVNTEKYGPVFVSPGGIAWAVQRNGNRLDNIAVKLTKVDVVGKSAIEKRQDAIKKAVRRQSIRVSRTQTAILTPSVVSIGNGSVMEVRNGEVPASLKTRT